MGKYLIQGYYTEKGLEGLYKEGGKKRKEAVAKAVSGLGGTLETFYYAFGENDIVAIVELPDEVSATAFSLVVNTAGTAKIKTIVLTTPEAMDEAVKRKINYRPPGH